MNMYVAILGGYHNLYRIIDMVTTLLSKPFIEVSNSKVQYKGENYTFMFPTESSIVIPSRTEDLQTAYPTPKKGKTNEIETEEKSTYSTIHYWILSKSKNQYQNQFFLFLLVR